MSTHLLDDGDLGAVLGGATSTPKAAGPAAYAQEAVVVLALVARGSLLRGGGHGADAARDSCTGEWGGGAGCARPPGSAKPGSVAVVCSGRANLLDSDGDYGGAVISYCDRGVREDARRWDRLRPTRGSFDFADGDAIVRFAKAAGLAVRGHALVFHSQVPPWLDTLRTRAEAAREMRKHIATVVGH